MKISILTDEPSSWYVPHGRKLHQALTSAGHDVAYVFSKSDLVRGDVCFLLSCSRLIEPEYLRLHRHNIVVHASDLPRNKGFAPMQWQVLEGRNEIPLTLFEATDAPDAGPYYFKSSIALEGTELYDELRVKLAKKINELCMQFIDEVDRVAAIQQSGEESFLRKRTRRDDELDPEKSIAEQFDHFRIADNERFPLWFRFRGRKYILKIFADEE